MQILFYLSIFTFLILCVLLSATILIQESKSLGLGASFGGDASDSVFGTSTAMVLKKFTAYLAAFFMMMCIVLANITSSASRQDSVKPVLYEEMITNKKS